MLELLMIMANTMPKEMIIEKLSQTLSAYKRAKTEEDIENAEHAISVICIIMLLKRVYDDKSIDEMLDDADRLSSISKLLNPNKN